MDSEDIQLRRDRARRAALADELFDSFMDIPRGNFPQDDLESVLELQEEITPLLLDYLDMTPEQVAAVEYQADGTADFRFMFSLILLGQFREQAAFPKLVAFFSTPGKATAEVTGDFITENLDVVLAATYNGNFALLSGMLERLGIDDYVRVAALQAMIILHHEQHIPSSVFHEYLHQLLDSYPADAGYKFWSLALGTLAELQIDAIYVKLLKIHDSGVIDKQLISREDLRRIHVGVYSSTLSSSSQIDVMSLKDWYWFCEVQANSIPKGAMAWPGGGYISWPDKGDEPPFWEKALQHIKAIQTHVRSEPKIGRNDPCPCGSGKKYKKCCYGKL